MALMSFVRTSCSIAAGFLSASMAWASWSVTFLTPPNAVGVFRDLSRVEGLAMSEQAGWTSFANGAQAGVWTGVANSWRSLHPAPAIESIATDVANGRSVGTVVTQISARAALWNNATSEWTDLTPPGVPLAGLTSIAFLGEEGWVQGGVVRVGADIRASLWRGTPQSWVNLHPTSYVGNSFVEDVSDTDQVGYVEGSVQERRASLWRNTAQSWVDLSPSGSTHSEATATDGRTQVGFALIAGVTHAGTWQGTASSWQSLHPAGASNSVATGVAGRWQVGYALFNGARRPALWRSSAQSFVDLASLVPDALDGEATDVIATPSVLTIGGFLRTSASGFNDAVLWSFTFCPADFNQDFQGDIFDYLDFADAFAREDPLADLNSNGGVDFFDYLSFVELFARGCP
ncbi:MAG: GC-type dockerin domain-anchored protein [Planctomycetota bacterium]|nr:GC-type dockerin domain-anchored protein [Planctomycetota bacterium]